jgi:hypothetical protein
VRRLASAALGLALLVGACSSAGDADVAGQVSSSPQESTFLAEHHLSGDAMSIVDQLERLGGDERPRELKASVRPDELQLSDADEQVTLRLPADRFYLSIAPYRGKTHECYFHSLTTCQGELAGEAVRVKIVDTSGEVLVEKETATNANGFVGFWLPKGASGTVELTTGAGTGSQPFSTGADDPTCMTTLRVA